MDLSPVGEIELNAGIQELRYQGNWKFMPENSVEGDYHGPFIHRIAFELFRKATGNAGSAGARTDIPDVIRSLPGGHMVQDYRRAGAPGSGRPVNEARNIYSAQLSERYGPEKAKQLLESLAPIVFVFPNLHYVMTHIRVIQPLAADASIVTYQPVMLKGVPDPINEQRLRNHELMFGPAASSRLTTSKSWNAIKKLFAQRAMIGSSSVAAHTGIECFPMADRRATQWTRIICAVFGSTTPPS